MIKIKKALIIFLLIVVTIGFAKLYISQTHYFSFTNLCNHNNGLIRSISSYVVQQKLSWVTLEEKKNIFLEMLFPSALGLPKEWSLSSETITVFCDSILAENKSEKEYILYNVAHTASLYKNLEVLRFLNQFGDIKHVFLEFEKPIGKESYEKLDRESRNIIANGGVGKLSCYN
ncbi:hypothetical protein [Pseudoalteromonas arctica]|uniref:Uncharacterized protein n=1 Tax=Pseudoalteromonas arctica TaxID=394751 RepID=A0A7Y0DR43_9GAMM|nr:hypothetical protein [Pseudoalteromonas arctica]NMM39918.1 hypothetical protein [Pseudoalteromonas arctica]